MIVMIIKGVISMKIFFRLLTILLLCFSLLHLHIYAKDNDSTGYHAIDYTPEERTQKVKKRLLYPRSYDPRSEGKVTAVKDQHNTETCWAYSTIALAESYLVNKGLETNDIDLSEHHLVYFTYHSGDDPLHNTTNDKVYIPTGHNYLSVGGNQIFTIQKMSCYSGLVDEKTVSAMPIDKNQPTTINPSYQYDDNEYVLKNAYLANYSIETVKELISQYGAVGISYQSSLQTTNESTCSIYNPHSSVDYANHTVTLVGWDDDYGKENFYVQPSHDGAWLMKNSWGQDAGDQGYYWISYEDTTLCDVVALTVEQQHYDHNYFYDGSLSIPYPFVSDDHLRMANIYEVKGNQNQLLKAVNIAVQSTDTNYSIDIYTHLKDLNDPTSGVLASSSTIGKTTYSGYYTVELNEAVLLTQGDYYSIVVTLDKPGYETSMMTQISYDAGWISFYSWAKPQQSFVVNDKGQWYDLYYHDEAGENLGYTAQIKGLTVDVEQPLESISLNKTYSLKVGEQTQLDVKCVPQHNMTKLKWQSSDSSIVSVDQEGKIKGINPGKAIITVTSENGITASCLICVEDQVTIKTETDDQELKLNSQSQKANQVMTSDKSFNRVYVYGLICMVIILMSLVKKVNKNN